MGTREKYELEAQTCLECAEGLYVEAEGVGQLPNFSDTDYWLTRAQVYATLALAASS